MATTSSLPQNPPEPTPLLDWLRRSPVVWTLLGTAAATVLEVVRPTIFIPEPLSSYREFLLLTVVFALVASWLLQQKIQKRRKLALLLGGVCLLVLVFIRVFFVIQVSYRTAENPATMYFLVGTEVIDPDVEGLSDEDVIKYQGSTWSDLKQSWGTSFVIVAVIYTLASLIFLQALVFLVTSISTGKRR
jgi:hypothetical protein